MKPTLEAHPVDRFIPYIFIGFFVGLVVLQSIFVVTAFRTFPGTVTAHPFQRGQTFNAILEEAEAQRSLGRRIGNWMRVLCFGFGASHRDCAMI